jgi:hypothetical protein
MTNLNWNIADWQDRDKKLLNEEFIIAVGSFAVVVMTAFIIGLL